MNFRTLIETALANRAQGVGRSRTTPKLYTVVHAHCGHVKATYDRRADAESLKRVAFAGGFHGWRVRLAEPGLTAKDVDTKTSCEVCAPKDKPSRRAARRAAKATA